MLPIARHHDANQHQSYQYSHAKIEHRAEQSQDTVVSVAWYQSATECWHLTTPHADQKIDGLLDGHWFTNKIFGFGKFSKIETICG